MGDLNTESDTETTNSTDPPLLALRHDPNIVDVVGLSKGPDGIKNLDWIFARGLKYLDGGLAPDDASDHPVDVEFEDANQ